MEIIIHYHNLHANYYKSDKVGRVQTVELRNDNDCQKANRFVAFHNAAVQC